MTTAKPLTRYGAMMGALASGLATDELHHVMERDPEYPEYPELPTEMKIATCQFWKRWFDSIVIVE